jgi:hypothetical protein
MLCVTYTSVQNMSKYVRSFLFCDFFVDCGIVNNCSAVCYKHILLY